MSCSECEQLRARIEELEALIGKTVVTPPLGVTRLSWRYFAVLAKRGSASREQLYAAVYGERPEAEQPKDDRIVDQSIGRLRRNIQRFGIRIDAVYGFGYKIREGDLRNARLLLQGGDASSGGVSDGHVLRFSEVDSDDPYLNVNYGDVYPTREEAS